MEQALQSWAGETPALLFEAFSNTLKLLQLRRPFAAEQHRHEAEDAEGAIDQAPPEGDAAQTAEGEGEGDDEDAGDRAEIEQPLVADGVAQGANKDEGDDEMAEGQPVGAVK